MMALTGNGREVPALSARRSMTTGHARQTDGEEFDLHGRDGGDRRGV